MERLSRIDFGYTTKKYCDNCGGIIVDEDEQGFFPCWCPCELKKMEQEAIDFQMKGANKQQEQKLKRLQQLSQMSDKMLESNIDQFETENDKDVKIKKTITDIIKSEKLLSHKRNGLIFTGETGVGKTFAMCCIANAYLERGTELIYTNPIRIKEIFIKSVRMDKNNEISDVEELKNIQLLIIDDFGVEKTSEFHYEQLYDIINYRYMNHLPIFITTNITTEELTNCYDIQSRRIFERLIEVSTIIEFTGENKRMPKQIKI